MTFWESLRGIFARGSSAGDYSRHDDDRLLELWEHRRDLTSDAQARLEAEASKRGLKLPNKRKMQEGDALAERAARKRAASHAAPPEANHRRFEAVAPLLKLQLFSVSGRTAYIEHAARDQMVTFELAPGLYAVLVYDYGSSETTVARRDFDAWQKPEVVVLARALENLDREAIIAQSLQLADRNALMLLGNGSFVAAASLRFADFAHAAGYQVPETGVLVAVPNWHVCVLYAEYGDDDAALTALHEVCARLFDYDDPVSDQVFRVREAPEGLVLPIWEGLDSD